MPVQGPELNRLQSQQGVVMAIPDHQALPAPASQNAQEERDPQSNTETANYPNVGQRWVPSPEMFDAYVEAWRVEHHDIAERLSQPGARLKMTAIKGPPWVELEENTLRALWAASTVDC